jgi:hypothetical protein
VDDAIACTERGFTAVGADHLLVVDDTIRRPHGDSRRRELIERTRVRVATAECDV